MKLQTQRLVGALGARIDGVDLSANIDEQRAQQLRDALHEHLVLVFPRQQLSPEHQLTFTRAFGPAEPHPLRTRRSVEGFPEVLMLENRPGQRGARNDYWHSDISHAERPPLASCLHAITVPEGRGDTMFCNMYRALESLSPGLRRMLDGRRAEHSGMATLRRNNEESSDGLRIENVPPPRCHPIVRSVPPSGRKALYVNPHFTTCLEGMSVDESRPILQTLTEAATRPENIYRHRWSPGDVVIWDNSATMHYAVRDYDESMPRLMHRTTAGGERPV